MKIGRATGPSASPVVSASVPVFYAGILVTAVGKALGLKSDCL